MWTTEEIINAQRVLRTGIRHPIQNIMTYKMPRQSGKTTSIIAELQDDPKMFVVVGNKVQARMYPKGLQKQVFTVSEVVEQSRRYFIGDFNKAVIDEGYFASPIWIKLYYYLGQHSIPTIVVGSD